MKTRPWAHEDTEKVRAIHEKMALGYRFPEVGAPLFNLKSVIGNGDGSIEGAAAVKLIGEAFLWLDQAQSDTKKARVVVHLLSDLWSKAVELGLEDVACFIPPQIEREFSPALGHMGFRRSPWACWGLVLGGKSHEDS